MLSRQKTDYLDTCVAHSVFQCQQWLCKKYRVNESKKEQNNIVIQMLTPIVQKTFPTHPCIVHSTK